MQSENIGMELPLGRNSNVANSGGLARSSDEVSVIEMEQRG